MLFIGLLFQSLLIFHHAQAMGIAGEICTAKGLKFIGEDGKPSTKQQQHQVCCCTAGDVVPPSENRAVHQEIAEYARIAAPISGQPATQWLAPLSRGPPSLS